MAMKPFLPMYRYLDGRSSRFPELIESLPGPHDRIGRALVNGRLQLEGHPEIFVVGDSAAAVGCTSKAPAGRACSHRTRATSPHGTFGTCGATNPLETYEYTSKGMLVSLGMNYAVVNISGNPNQSGYFAWLFWNAVHLYKLVGLKKTSSGWQGIGVLGLIFSPRRRHRAQPAQMQIVRHVRCFQVTTHEKNPCLQRGGLQ